MPTLKRTLISVLPLALYGCGAFVPVANLEGLPKDEQAAVQAVKLMAGPQLIGKSFDVLEIVEGNSCQNKLTDPPATRTRAIEQARYHAHKAGADAITNVQCGARESTSLRTNCWELISCTAEAIKFSPLKLGRVE
jgi:uncharacterized protein YbjQ (UPF0145 family)